MRVSVSSFYLQKLKPEENLSSSYFLGKFEEKQCFWEPVILFTPLTWHHQQKQLKAAAVLSPAIVAIPVSPLSTTNEKLMSV